MSRSAPLFRRFAFVAALFAAVATAHAADDDFDLAEALYRRGYLDLAEEKFNELIAKGGTRKAEGEYGLALLKRWSALRDAGEVNPRRRKPYTDVLKLFDEADAVFAGFIKNNGKHPRVLDAMLERARLLQKKAEYQSKSIDESWLPDDVKDRDVLSQIASAYDTAVGLLKPVEDDIRKQLETEYESNGDNTEKYEELNHELSVVWLSRLVALYGKGAALPPGDATGKAALKQVNHELLDEYLWNYSDRIQGVWALHYSGLCHWKLDEIKEGFDVLLDAAKYAQPTDNPAVRSVTFQSFAKLAEMALSAGGEYVGRCIQQMSERLEGPWKDYRKDRDGQVAALALSRLYDVSGDTRKALEIAQDVLAQAGATGTGMDREAGELVSEYLTKLPPGAVSVDPANLERVYLAKFREGDPEGCIRAAQGLLSACTTRDQLDKFGWKAWEYIGLCYGQQKRWYASFLAFDEIERAWRVDRENETLNEATSQRTANLRLIALNQLSRQSGSAEDKKNFETENEQFLNDHPDSPDAQGAGDREASNRIAEGKDFLRSGDREAANAKFAEALKLYKAKDPRSDMHDLDEAVIADTLRLMGRYDEAIAAAKAWLDKARPDTSNSKIRRARLQGRVLAIRTLIQSPADQAARALEAKEKETYKSASALLIKNIDQYEQQFLESVQNGELPILQWRVEGLIGTDQVQEAEKYVTTAVSKFPDSRVTLYLAATVAAKLVVESEEWRAKDDVSRAQSLMIRAARLREFVLDHAGERKPEVIVATGVAYQKGGDYAKAEKLLLEALQIYDAQAREDDALRVRVMLIDLLVDQGKFGEAIPQLEKRLVEDDAVRPGVLKTLGESTAFTTVQMKDLLDKMSKSKPILNALSKAYLKAKDGTQQRLIAAINLSFILWYHHPKDKLHDAEYIEYLLRWAQANYEFGVDFKNAVALDNCITKLRNGIIVAGLLDTYEETVPGSRHTIEVLLQNAERARALLK